jgi:hypothetical protein
MTAIESSSFPKLIAPDQSAPDLSSSLPGKPVHESAQTQIPNDSDAARIAPNEDLTD